jgi:small acid-soluble spore protein D (minor alpha/beta-type SASP)
LKRQGAVFERAVLHNLKTAQKRRTQAMASNKTLVPEAKEALERFKMEAASEVGVNLKQGYNGDLTSRQAGSVGGQMVKKMIESYENSIKTK